MGVWEDGGPGCRPVTLIGGGKWGGERRQMKVDVESGCTTPPLPLQCPVSAGQHTICHSTHFYWKPSRHQHGATQWAPDEEGDKPFSLFTLPKHLSPSQFCSLLLSACQENSGDDGGGSDINCSCCRMGVYFEQEVLQPSLQCSEKQWDLGTIMKLKLREVTQLSQSPTANKRQHWNRNLSLSKAKGWPLHYWALSVYILLLNHWSSKFKMKTRKPLGW